MRRLFVFAMLISVLCAAGALAVPLADAQPDAVVVYDQKFSPATTSVGAMKKVRDFLTGFGFEAVYTEQLMEWMESAIGRGARGTLVVMNMDAVPEWMAGEKGKTDSILRRYLEAGGTVVWWGDYPGHKISFQLDQHENRGGEGSVSLIGIDASGDTASAGPAEPTADGKALGLTSGWESRYPVSANEVTKVLAATKDGHAAAWTKEFVAGSPGFVRLWDKSMGEFTDDMAVQLFHVVSGLLPRMGGAKTMSRIYLHKPSDYYPLVHREGDRLTREVRVSRFDESVCGCTEYELVVRKGKKIFDTIPLASDGPSFFIKELRVPIYEPDEELALVSRAKGKEKELATTVLNESRFYADEDFAAYPEINQIDFGYALTPADIVLASAGQSVKARFRMSFPGSGKSAHKVKASLTLSEKEGDAREAASGEFSVSEGRIVSGEVNFDCAGISPGRLLMRLSMTEGGKEIYSAERTLYIVKNGEPYTGFGAYYTQVGYLGQIGVFDYPTKKWSRMSWSRAWERGPDDDIVVMFPNGNRYVFWRGSGYVPFWMSGAGTGMTYEWLEASQNRGVTQDAVEPLQDKECRYSHASIVSNGAARAVVDWRYAEIGLNYVINKNEWADEEYVFYPDGFGVRKVTARVEPMTSHESIEFIIMLPPGINPFDVYPREVFRIMSPDGNTRASVSYPNSSAPWDKDTPAVFRINYNMRDKNTPVLATRSFGGFGTVYDGWKDDGRYISPNYWGVHFPVQRGYPTTRQQPPGWRERAGHASIATIDTAPLESKPINSRTDRFVWAWLIGNTDKPDGYVLEASRSWLTPAPLKVTSGGGAAEYDPYQRGYVIGYTGPGAVEAKFAGAADVSVFNPVLIIENWPGGDARVTVDGAEPIVWQSNVEHGYMSDRLIVWIGEMVGGTATVRVERR